MRLIDADKLPFNTVGICDAQENFYGFAEVTFAEDIETAPTVDAKPIIHAKWKDVGYGRFGTILECSNCASEDEFGKFYDYCPCCGAVMDGKT